MMLTSAARELLVSLLLLSGCKTFFINPEKRFLVSNKTVGTNDSVNYESPLNKRAHLVSNSELMNLKEDRDLSGIIKMSKSGKMRNWRKLTTRWFMNFWVVMGRLGGLFLVSRTNVPGVCVRPNHFCRGEICKIHFD